jgi:hypothetical protein
MSHFALRPCVLFLSLFITLSFSSKAQSFEISSDVCDSLAPNSFLIHVSGYATFTDSMIMTVELVTADSLQTIVYSASKDFGVNGSSTLTNFTFDPVTELFTLEIGNYPTKNYSIRITSSEVGQIKEELNIDTF